MNARLAENYPKTELAIESRISTFFALDCSQHPLALERDGSEIGAHGASRAAPDSGTS